jgi:hypothetical protein
MGATLQGADKLFAALKELAEKDSRKAARAAIQKGMTVIARAIRAAVPGQYPEIKKTIGKRLAKSKSGPNQGQIAAKVGAAVGKKIDKTPPKKRARPGVGISARNIHWFLLGTGLRTTGQRKWRVKNGWRTKQTNNPRRNAGRMRPIAPGLIARGLSAGASEAIDVMLSTLKEKIEAAGAAKK